MTFKRGVGQDRRIDSKPRVLDKYLSGEVTSFSNLFSVSFLSVRSRVLLIRPDIVSQGELLRV